MSNTDNFLFDKYRLNERMKQLNELEEAFNAGKQGYASFQVYCEQKSAKAFEQFKQEQLKSKRDWEILSFTAFDGKKYNNPNGINSWIANGDVITSVRRLSDGEVFSVDDYLVDYEKILSFHLYEDRLVVTVQNLKCDSRYVKGRTVSISEIKKEKKQPLFTTEDGVEIFDGDNCWVVENMGIVFPWNQCCAEGMEKNSKYFSTKDGAENYLANEKKLFSVTDVMLAVSVFFKHPAIAYDTLNKLAKDKLNMKT